MKPILRLGADSPFGLALPSAAPTATQMYGPRGVWFDSQCLVIADTGNHRVLIWHHVPQASGTAADVVLGQPDFTSEGPNAGGPERGMFMPTGVLVHEGRLLVADSWNHRILVWHNVPQRSGAPADHVWGQRSLTEVAPQGGGKVSAAGLYWPYNLSIVGDWFWVADTGNRRVLGWESLPLDGRPADVVLGQPTAESNEENRGGAPTASSFRWPHAVAGNNDVLFVADAGNHRVLAFAPLPVQDTPAASLLGQASFCANEELPHRKQGAHRLRFPYGASSDGDTLAVADTANNRILLWDRLPTSGFAAPAHHVLGQPDFDAAGENRWKSVSDDSLCWPYGVCLAGDRLAIADSGNNRVVLWDVSRPPPPELPRRHGEDLQYIAEHSLASSFIT